MSDPIDQLVVDVRAGTQGFAQDLAQMRGQIDTSLIDGFSRAGDVLEKGLVGALRRGSTGFDDLKRVAMTALGEIATQGLKSLIGPMSGGGNTGGRGAPDMTGLVGAVLGLPGRAIGGEVAPQRPYLVGERGPELFVPTSAGRVETMAPAGAPGRDVRIAIQVASPRGASAPASLRRSTRQMASAVRRALTDR